MLSSSKSNFSADVSLTCCTRLQLVLSSFKKCGCWQENKRPNWWNMTHLVAEFGTLQSSCNFNNFISSAVKNLEVLIDAGDRCIWKLCWLPLHSETTYPPYLASNLIVIDHPHRWEASMGWIVRDERVFFSILCMFNNFISLFSMMTPSICAFKFPTYQWTIFGMIRLVFCYSKTWFPCC